MNYINEEHTNATTEQTENIVKLMQELGYDVEYGNQQVSWEFEDDHQRAEFENDFNNVLSQL